MWTLPTHRSTHNPIQDPLRSNRSLFFSVDSSCVFSHQSCSHKVRTALMEESNARTYRAPAVISGILTSHCHKLPHWLQRRQTWRADPSGYGTVSGLNPRRDPAYTASSIRRMKNIPRHAGPHWRTVNGRWDGGRKEGNQREKHRQPSWGDGTHTAQAVSLTTLPVTGWLTQNHTPFAKYQETVWLHT